LIPPFLSFHLFASHQHLRNHDNLPAIPNPTIDLLPKAISELPSPTPSLRLRLSRSLTLHSTTGISSSTSIKRTTTAQNTRSRFLLPLLLRTLLAHPRCSPILLPTPTKTNPQTLLPTHRPRRSTIFPSFSSTLLTLRPAPPLPTSPPLLSLESRPIALFRRPTEAASRVSETHSYESGGVD
jgi:hypothetical protein